jgi:cytoskeleton protein RodZ
MGLSVSDVAQRIKLHRRQLEAIERGDWAALPGMAFARGSVRSYARLVGIDPTALLQEMGGYESLDSLQGKPTIDAPMPRGAEISFGSDRRFRRLPWALLGLAGVVALAVFFGRSERGLSGLYPSMPTSVSVPAAQAPTPAPASESPAPPLSAATSPAPPSNPQPAVPDAAAASTSAAPAASAASAESSRSAASGLRVLTRQDAWIEIRDGAGKVLHMGTVKPGAPLELTGPGPFVYTLGNATQVELEFAGKPVDLRPVTIMPNNIAKGRVP